VLTKSGDDRFRRRDYRAGESPRSLGIADLTQDEKLDLVVDKNRKAGRAPRRFPSSRPALTLLLKFAFA
jgi:hypothetical protein